MLNGYAVLEQLDGAEAVDGHAACAHVSARLAARCLDPEAGNRFESLGHAGRRLQPKLLLVDPGDGIARFRLGPLPGAGAASNDDLFPLRFGGRFDRRLRIVRG